VLDRECGYVDRLNSFGRDTDAVPGFAKTTPDFSTDAANEFDYLTPDATSCARKPDRNHHCDYMHR
jgi:hypothetical protein